MRVKLYKQAGLFWLEKDIGERSEYPPLLVVEQITVNRAGPLTVTTHHFAARFGQQGAYDLVQPVYTAHLVQRPE